MNSQHCFLLFFNEILISAIKIFEWLSNEINKACSDDLLAIWKIITGQLLGEWFSGFESYMWYAPEKSIFSNM